MRRSRQVALAGDWNNWCSTWLGELGPTLCRIGRGEVAASGPDWSGFVLGRSEVLERVAASGLEDSEENRKLAGKTGFGTGDSILVVESGKSAALVGVLVDGSFAGDFSFFCCLAGLFGLLFAAFEDVFWAYCFISSSVAMEQLPP